MVRALLDGSKTQTRRIVKPQHLQFFDHGAADMLGHWDKRPIPYGKTGDGLWVKETHWRDDEDGAILYAANPDDFATVQQNKLETGSARYNWKPSIFMRREYSRITLKITGVRVARLQDISEADAIAEGVDVTPLNTGPCGAFQHLWETINGWESWDANPSVWVVEFTRHNAGNKPPTVGLD